MSVVEELGRWLEHRLPTMIAEAGVPAASVAISMRDEGVEAATGLLSRATGIAATVDSIFQIGSVTKSLTASLVMRLADDGAIALDEPARTWLPELRLGDARAADQITVRHLLSHTAGFEGDVFTDTGKGDDCLEKYVALLREVPQVFAPGEMFSYNNAGYCVLGRLIEVLRDHAYDDCLRDMLISPLGLTHVAGDPYDAVLHRTAVGHVRTGSSNALEPTSVWAMARSNAPAGSMLAMPARELLTFARMHLAGGLAASGERVLSARAVADMQQPQVTLPDLNQGSAWGLGWELFRQPGATVFGHDGTTIGQSAFLRILPEHDLAFVVLTNGGSSRRVFDAVARQILRECVGVEPPPEPEIAQESPPPDWDRYIGTYQTSTDTTVVSQDERGRLWLDRQPIGVLADLDEPPYRTELRWWRKDSFIPLEPEGGVRAPLAFVGVDDTARASYLHTGRAARRTR